MKKYRFTLKNIILLLPLFFSFNLLIAQGPNPTSLSEVELNKMVDALSLEEQIAQLMMVAMYPKQGESHQEEIIQLIQEYKIGGLIVFQGTSRQIQDDLTTYQSYSEIPLLTSIDGEWGPGM